MAQGTLVHVMGPVLDVRFPEDAVPPIQNALYAHDETQTVYMEVMYHMGGGVVRCIAIEATEGLHRGMEVVDTGSPITVPVGTGVLGLSLIHI